MLAAGTFVLGTDGFLLSGLLPQVARDLHVGISEAGQLTTVFAVVYAGAAVLPALHDKELGLDLSMMVHQAQEFAWGEPVIAGMEITTVATVADVRVRGSVSGGVVPSSKNTGEIVRSPRCVVALQAAPFNSSAPGEALCRRCGQKSRPGSRP